jgi:hypothetical protein
VVTCMSDRAFGALHQRSSCRGNEIPTDFRNGEVSYYIDLRGPAASGLREHARKRGARRDHDAAR